MWTALPSCSILLVILSSGPHFSTCNMDTALPQKEPQTFVRLQAAIPAKAFAEPVLQAGADPCALAESAHLKKRKQQ